MKTSNLPSYLLLALLNAVPIMAQDASTSGVKDTKEAMQQRLYEITGKDTTVVSFAKKSTRISAAHLAELKTTFNAVKEDAKIKEILILAYSDSPYPKGQAGDLPKSSITLAQKRGVAVEKQLEKFGAKNVKIYNMAVKASWYEKYMVTSDAQVKQEAKETLADQDADDAFYQALGKQLGSQGGPGKVVVVARREFSYSH